MPNKTKCLQETCSPFCVGRITLDESCPGIGLVYPLTFLCRKPSLSLLKGINNKYFLG